MIQHCWTARGACSWSRNTRRPPVTDGFLRAAGTTHSSGPLGRARLECFELLPPRIKSGREYTALLWKDYCSAISAVRFPASYHLFPLYFFILSPFTAFPQYAEIASYELSPHPVFVSLPSVQRLDDSGRSACRHRWVISEFRKRKS